jgi:uroporphyrinogen-III decarboxylase
MVACEIVDLDSLALSSSGPDGPKPVLLGNLNPTVLRNATATEVTDAIAECHRQAGPRFIVGAGCEVPRDTPLENLLALSHYARTHCP